MWGVLFASAAIFALVAVFFLWTRFQRFAIVRKLAAGRKWLRRMLGLIPLAVFGIFLPYDTINTGIVLLYLALFWVLGEIIAGLVRRIMGKKNTGKKRAAAEVEDGSAEGYRPYWLGVMVLLFTVCYFSIAAYQDYHVWEKDYQLTTDKDLGMDRLRIAQVTDSHVGATFDGEGFARHMKRIQKSHPDILVITGDYVDDGTSKDDMLRCCQALKEFEAPLGKYFIYGNHDKGYFTYRNFTWQELEEALADAGIEVLKDETALVDDNFYIVGRKDRSDPDREEIDKLVSPLDPSKYIIVLDHQPNDFTAEAATAADLVLSGHTHGGQMIIMKLAAELMRANDRTYGMERRNGSTFIVSSGISDWEIKFKTGTQSEFCIIDVEHR